MIEKEFSSIILMIKEDILNQKLYFKLDNNRTVHWYNMGYRFNEKMESNNFLYQIIGRIHDRKEIDL